jgi:hypothetical protein
MRKLIYILLFVCPGVLSAQQSWYKSSPLDYMWMNVGNAGFSAGEASYTSLAYKSGEPYVAYVDAGDSSKATVMKFDGTDWVTVGNEGFSAAGVEYTSLAFSPSGQPYVAFGDLGNSGYATVMMFDGLNWVNVGTAGFSAGAVEYTSLAFSPSGQPYVAFGDLGNSGYATVMMFDGVNWVDVGNAGFSAGVAKYTSIAFNPFDGQPYVAYEDFGNSQKATVMKFDGNSWVNVGLAGFSAGMVWYTSLAFTSTDSIPYVAYEDFANNGATVMKFNGTAWAEVGNAHFSGGNANYTSLVFSPSGQPYVAYKDLLPSSEGKATVIKFDGISWSYVGSAGFSSGQADYTCLAFNTSAEPYVAYSDYENSHKATVMKYGYVLSGIKESGHSHLSIYPNPSTDKITIETPGATQKSNLVIMNIEGQQILSRQITGPRTQIDISALPNGVYFVRLTSDSEVEEGKVVKGFE